jgi:type I restriction enzyme M protein
VLPEGIFNNPSLAYVREFTENRAFLGAVVSLPQDTFVSSGASVKCSLLFLQKFMEDERERLVDIDTTVWNEVEAKHVDEIEMERSRLEIAIDAAKTAKDAEQRKTLQKELRDYLKEMEAKKTTEARQLVKERFDYPIFMYEAEKVGISATGEEDQNELYPTAYFGYAGIDIRRIATYGVPRGRPAGRPSRTSSPPWANASSNVPTRRRRGRCRQSSAMIR